MIYPAPHLVFIRNETGGDGEMLAKGKRYVGALTAALMMLVGVFAFPASVSAVTVSLNDEITTDNGSTEILGGGDYFFVRFGDDAMFGIVWGNETNPNNVYFVSVVARHLAYAHVYDKDGEVVEKNHAVKVYTMYAVKLDGMIEFNDTNDNGLLPYLRSYNEEQQAFTDYTRLGPEPIYKKVDLNTSWNASTVEHGETDDAKTWSFSLNASDLPYELLENASLGEVGDNVLNEFELTFHLEARAMQMDNASMPQWRVTVTRGPLGNPWFMLDNVDKLEDMHVNGDVVAYHVKWDKAIEGWDFDPANGNPMLLMEFETMIGNSIPAGLFTWMQMLQYERMIAQMNEFGSMECETTDGDVEVNETTGGLLAPKALATPELKFGGDHSKIGKLEWVSNVTVDGLQAQVQAQLMAGHRVTAVAMVHGEPTVFTGFVALQAMTFPGGEMIVHDPTYSVEALVDVSLQDKPAFPLLMALVIGAVLVIVAVATVTVMRGKPGSKAPQTYEKNANQRQGDWSKYYSKK